MSPRWSWMSLWSLQNHHRAFLGTKVVDATIPEPVCFPFGGWKPSKREALSNRNQQGSFGFQDFNRNGSVALKWQGLLQVPTQNTQYLWNNSHKVTIDLDFLLNSPPQKRAGRFELYKRYWLLGKKKESKNMETHAFNWFHSRNAFQLPFDSFVVWCFLLNVSPKKLELSDDSKVIKLQVMRYILSSC